MATNSMPQSTEDFTWHLINIQFCTVQLIIADITCALLSEEHSIGCTIWAQCIYTYVNSLYLEKNEFKGT